MFDNTKPTVQMLGRWQPFHDGHLALFKRAHEKTGQVVLMVRNMPLSDSNPFTFDQIKERAIEVLGAHGYHYLVDYDIISVPNVVNITYGRDVGYTITKEEFDDTIHQISATKVREQLRAEGKL